MKRNVIEIFMNSLSDKPFDEVRYKLIIDLSEDESITQLLFMFGILKRKNTRTYMCSDFLGDGQLQKVHINNPYNLHIVLFYFYRSIQ